MLWKAASALGAQTRHQPLLEDPVTRHGNRVRQVTGLKDAGTSWHDTIVKVNQPEELVYLVLRCQL